MRNINDLISNISEGTRAAHAFIIEGRSARGRSSFITSLAAGLECSAPDIDMRPCGSCPACRQVAAGTSMDIVRMSKSAGQGKSGRETYRVDDAAAFIERLSMGSYGRYLIGIVDEADTLSEIIQNKLLKTLEEPAPDTIILLGVSNRDNLLDTVQSRLSFVRTADYEGYTASDAEAEGADEVDADAKLQSASETIAAMYADRKHAFHEIRSALEKNIKSREDALYLLNVIEDEFRERMTAAARGERQGSPAACAHAIEEINKARMDIRREMQHTKALKRLYLDI